MHDLTPNERCVLKNRIWPCESNEPNIFRRPLEYSFVLQSVCCTVYMKESVQKKIVRLNAVGPDFI